MKPKKVIIPAAGLGTRLYPATKNQPKEMLPLPVYEDGKIIPKPALQIIFEQFYNLGIREFCFVIGASKEAVIRHFTPDDKKLKDLRDKENIRKSLEKFYKKLYDSQISYVVQPKPLGFGDAVLQVKNFVGDEDFWLIAGDTIIIGNSQNRYSHFEELEKIYKKYKPAITLSIERVENPVNYGVVEGEIVEKNVIKIKRAIEKPKKPPSNYAITALYIFSPEIFSALEEVKRRKRELELTYGIDALAKKEKVYGVFMKGDERRYDIGTSESYFETVKELYELAKKKILII